MYIVLKDKELLFKGTENECFVFLLRSQSASVSHACKYEGYEIVEDKPADGVQYALTGGPGDKCVSNGCSWYESKVEEE